ncbi:MAG: uroporphyrinogen-III C-methyltransferase [Nitrospinae bacterium]|nr:uroporphyrinogen-III C-methyltransferase [Nitrospinota bacterium]
MYQGKVQIVGAGPGDPDLLTLKAAKALTNADVVVYDRLVNPEVLELCPENCQFINAGKSTGRHTMNQDDINETLIHFAHGGFQVVRLKGGDPFVFGRGGEEAQALAEAGIHFEVIPGISSALAVPAYAGIPVTHRSLASSFTVVTAHEDPQKPETKVDYAHLAKDKGTLVFLMGARSIGRISAALIDNGMSKDTATAIIENGATNRQSAYRCSLGEASSLAQREEISPPAIFLVGPVAGLEDLVWFEADESQEISWRCPTEEFSSKSIS